MSDTTSLQVVVRHLPLLRAPLLLNNIICLILSGLRAYTPVYQTQLALISISFLIGLFDLIRYNIRKRASHEDHSNLDQDLHGVGIAAATDGLLSVALLIIWIIGLVAYSPWAGLTGIIATFGAFIAW